MRVISLNSNIHVCVISLRPSNAYSCQKARPSLVQISAKPLHEQVLALYQLVPGEPISVKSEPKYHRHTLKCRFKSKYNNFHARKWIKNVVCKMATLCLGLAVSLLVRSYSCCLLFRPQAYFRWGTLAYRAANINTMHSPRSCLKEALWIIITFCIVYLTLCHMFMQRGSISKRMFRGVRNVENQSHAAGNTLHTRIIENIGDDGVSQNHNSSHIDRHLKQGSECNSTYDELAHSQDDSGKRGKKCGCGSISTHWPMGYVCEILDKSFSN